MMNKSDIKDLRQHWRYILKDCLSLADWLNTVSIECGIVSKRKEKISKRSKNYFNKINYTNMVNDLLDCGLSRHQIVSCVEKTSYDTLDEALIVATKYNQSIYVCDYCHYYHLASK